MNATQSTVAVETVAYVLNDETRAMIVDEAVSLSTADKSFESAIASVATNVAKIMTDAPTYDHWVAVAEAFQSDYTTERKCTPETSQKRWFAVVKAMADTFALEKPAKPTKAAEVKAAQRKGAAAEADKLIADAGVSTPADILALSMNADAPLSKPVVAALAKIAGETAAKGAEAANKAAKDETKALRETIRKGVANLNLSQLRQVAELMNQFRPAGETVDETTEETADAE